MTQPSTSARDQARLAELQRHHNKLRYRHKRLRDAATHLTHQLARLRGGLSMAWVWDRSPFGWAPGAEPPTSLREFDRIHDAVTEQWIKAQQLIAACAPLARAMRIGDLAAQVARVAHELQAGLDLMTTMEAAIGGLPDGLQSQAHSIVSHWRRMFGEALKESAHDNPARS